MKSYPKVGVGVYVFNAKDEILIGKRKSKHGQDMWSPPGGHLEMGESFIDCAIRETKEETGVEISDIDFWGVTNDVFADKHYVTIHLKAIHKSGVPEVREPDKFEKWEWRIINNLPPEGELFLPVVNFLKQIK